MSFVSFEDETALYETVLFPDLYERYFPLLYRAAPLLVHGVVRTTTVASSSKSGTSHSWNLAPQPKK